MKLLFAGGAGIPALVTLTVIVGTQYSSTQGSQPQDPAAVVAEGEAGAGTCADGEACDAYVAGRDGDLSPSYAPLASNTDPAAMLDLLMQQTAGGGGTPVSSVFLCSSPLDCLDDLPGPGDLPLPTFAFTPGGSLPSIDGGQEGEPLELVGHGTRDAEFGGAPDVAGSPGMTMGGDGRTPDGAGSPGGAGGYLNAGGNVPSVAGGAPAASEENEGGSPGQATFLNASNGGTSSSGNSGPVPETGDEPAADDDPVTSSNTTVKLFVEDLLLGDEGTEGSGDDGGGSQSQQAFAGGDESQDDSSDGDTGKGPSFDDVLDQFSGDEGEDEYAGLRTPDDGGDTDLTPSEVPEPASMMMFGTGLLLAVAHLRRRGKQAR